MSFSQEGEDMILRCLLSDINKGFYIDIGAYHPMRFSNTCYFYRKGWRGINIEATPNSIKLFNKYRSEDINLELALSDKKEELIYSIFNEAALNGFLNTRRIKKLENKGYRLIEKKLIKTTILSEVLEKYISSKKRINFMSIDVEGHELKILKSNNWEKYKPDYLLVEMLNCNFEEVLGSELYNFIINKGYKLVAKTIRTFFFEKVNKING